MMQRKSCFAVMFRATPTETKSKKSDCTDSIGAISTDLNSKYPVLLELDTHSSNIEAQRLKNVAWGSAAGKRLWKANWLCLPTAFAPKG